MPVELEAIYLKLNPCPGVPETEVIILSLATRPSSPCGFRLVGFASPAFTRFAFFRSLFIIKPLYLILATLLSVCNTFCEKKPA